MPKAPFPYIRGHSFNLKILMWLMKNQMNWIWILVALFLFGCGNGKQKESDGLITVDVSKSYPKKELILQDLFDIEYVPLETTDEMLTEGHIQYISDNYMIFKNLGRMAGEIFIFDRQGKAVRKINRLGQSGEEYLNILGIDYDEQADELFVNSHYSDKVFVYDSEGNYKRSFDYLDGILYNPIKILDTERLIAYDDYSEYDKVPEKRDCYLILSREDGRLLEKIHIPYEEKKSLIILRRDLNGKLTGNWGIRNTLMPPYQDGWLLIEPSADTIYTYSASRGLMPLIVRTPPVNEMDPEVFLFPTIFTDRYVFMQAVERSFNFGIDKDVPRTNLIYDKTEQTAYEGEVINRDFEGTPVNLWFAHRVIMEFNDDEIAFATRLEAPDLVEALNDGKLRGPLKEIASDLDEEDNPVILIAKYKK